MRMTDAEREALSAHNRAAWQDGRNREFKQMADAVATVATVTLPPGTLQAGKKIRITAQSVTRDESKIEAMLALQLKLAGIPEPVRNFKGIPGRRFEFDFAWPDLMIAIEVQGMAHRIKEKFEADIEKRNLAREAGWTVIEVSGKTIRDGRAIRWITPSFKKCGVFIETL